MDITLGNRSADSGCFNFVLGADGDVSFDDTEAHAVMTTVVEDRGTYAIDADHGSDLYKIKSLTSRTPSQAESVALDALSQLESDHLIVAESTKVSATKRGNALFVDVSWESPTGARSRQLISL